LISRENFWVATFQLLKVFNGLVSVLLVPAFLSSSEQGFWFLMLSFGSVVLLFSAAQNSLVLIFSAHEFKGNYFKNCILSGRKKSLNNLMSFINYSKKFFLMLLLGISMIVFTIFYFYSTVNYVNTVFLLYVIGLFLYSVNYSILSYVESFQEIAQAYFFKSLLMFMWVSVNSFLLYKGFGLYSLSNSILFSMIAGFIFIIYKYKRVILQVFFINVKLTSKKKKIFLSYFTKNSFSMISGFLLFQIYTPLVYAYKGEVFTGKVGLSIAIFTALFSVTTSFLQIKLPKIIFYISHHQYQNAYKLYYAVNTKILVTYTILMIIGFFLLFYVPIFEVYKARVVNQSSFLILAIAWYMQLFVYIMITYTRLFKRELFIAPTIFSVIFILSSTSLILKYLSTDFVFLGFLCSYFLSFPWIYIKYKKFVKNKGRL